ncbi:MAG: LPS biosynthesis protein PseA [Candidatus Marinimicrobia bacterium]|nr:LPS biosynthesis protein PseA [Candidatus Neomarinimicrobiota bacterium]
MKNSNQNIKVEFCKKCVMSNQKVLPSIVTDDNKDHSNKVNIPFKNSICNACVEVEKKYKKIDWKEREIKFKNFLNKYRSRNGSYDCIVPGSGGKDSVFQAQILKEKYNMNPLTFTFSPHIYTEVGMKNFHNWPLKADVPNYLFTPSGRVHSKLTNLAFNNLLHPFQPFILGQRNMVVHMAKKFKIPLIFQGEPQSERGGMEDEIDQFEMLPRYWSKKKNQKILVAGLELDELEKKHDITKFDIEYYLPMDEDEALREQIRIIYLGYFENLQPQENFYLAAKLTDFKPNDRRTEQTYSKYNSIDDKIDPFHYYTAYTKFGYGRCTEEASIEIREGYINRDEAVKLVHKYDHEFPERYFKEFLDYIKISENEFYEKLDEFRPSHLWDKVGNDPTHCKNWRLKVKVE